MVEAVAGVAPRLAGEGLAERRGRLWRGRVPRRGRGSPSLALLKLRHCARVLPTRWSTSSRLVRFLPIVQTATASTGGSSFSPLATMSSISSGNGRCSFRASTVSPSSQRSNSSDVVRITGIALGWIGATMALAPWSETRTAHARPRPARSSARARPPARPEAREGE